MVVSRLKISNDDGRRLLLHVQGLSEPPRRKLDRDGVLEIVQALGFVQVDSINTLERAHHHILFSRNQTYRRQDLTRLLEQDRRLFENWTHDAAIIPSAFFPYWRHRFEQERVRLREYWRKWRREGFEEAVDMLRARVAAEGAIRARDVTSPRKGGGGGWWDWAPEKTALEYLWRTGEFAVCHRRSFQKVYDLAERVIPPEHHKTTIDRADSVDWACREALRRLGFATHGEIAGYWALVSVQEAKDWVAKMRASGALVEVDIDAANGAKPRSAVAFADVCERISEAPEPPARIRALNPFDPLIRDRRRLEHVFGFNYRIEVFTPEAKRRYGYYVFPLLEGDRFVGRVDAKHERDRDVLAVRAVWFEPGVKAGRNRRRLLTEELDRLRRFCGAEAVEWDGRISPDG
ncbi:MAG: crosslink repair DNA glycosylase YcaQ family protein [Pseudomonadota bacterium]